jgi:uncharacterized membrane protein YeiH
MLTMSSNSWRVSTTRKSSAAFGERAMHLYFLQSITWGTFQWTGNFTTLDLIAATTNALNGALLARRPDHARGFTIVGILLMALLGGIGGGITRDVIVNQVPAALTNPAYILLCLLAGGVGYFVAYERGQLFREGFFQLMTAFSLPWYAIVGAQKGIDNGIPILGSLLLAVIGPTTGRYLIDISCGVLPKQFIRSEWWVGTAVLTGATWILLYWLGAGTWGSAGGALLLGFCFRLTALYRGWEEPLAKEPAGVVKHRDAIPFGRKLSGKSSRELHELGLLPIPTDGKEAENDKMSGRNPTGS